MADGSTNILNSLNLQPVSADPSTPKEGDLQFSDGTARAKGTWQYKDGAWAEFGGAGGAGGINYLEGDNTNAENGVGDWVTYADAAGENPVDGTGGSATITFTQNTTTPLRGTGDFKFTKDAANRQGEGASVDFTIEKADQAQKLTISFDYDASAANYADDDIRISVYDVTNANLIRINGEDLKAGSGKHYAQFQAASDSTSYRLIIHQASTKATSYDVYLDNVSVGPTNLAFGTIVTDWEDFTPTGTWTTNTTYTGKYRRVGDTADIEITLELAGAPNSATLEVDLPPGLVIDTSKIDDRIVHSSFGLSSFADNGGNTYGGQVQYADNTTVRPMNVRSEGSGNEATLRVTTQAQPVTFASGDRVFMRFSLPIQGWSSNAKMSEDLGNRDIRVQGSGNGGTVLTANTTNIDFTETEDTTASWNGTQFTASETADYIFMGAVVATASTAFQVDYYIDGTSSGRAGDNDAGNSGIVDISGAVRLTKGEVLSFRSNTAKTLLNDSKHSIFIKKLASPQTMLETETVAARASGNPASAAAGAPVIFPTSDFDSHGSYSVSTGLYTVAVSGYYRVSGYVESANATITLNIAKNGSTDVSGGITDSNGEGNFYATVSVNKGDTLSLEPSGTLDVSSGHISFERIK